MDQSINIPSDSGSSISVSTTQIAALIAAGGIIPGEYYSITNPQQGGTIVLQAVSTNSLSPNGIWLRPTNLPGFGWIRLTGGAAGSVDTLSVNGVNQMTASVPFLTNLNTTATNVAININANINATYTAIGILDTIVVYQKSASSLANTHIVAATTTTITTGFAQAISNGYDSTIQSLIIGYDFVADKIRSCIDPVQNISFSISKTYLTVYTQIISDPIVSFRWGDTAYFNIQVSDGYIVNNFIAGVSIMFAMRVSQGAAIQNNVCGNGAYGIFDIDAVYNTGLIENNLFINTTAFFARSMISGRFSGNIVSGTSSSFGRININLKSQTTTTGFINNVVSGNSASIQSVFINAASSVFGSNTISANGGSIQGIHINGFTATMNSNTISVSNGTIINVYLNGYTCAFNSNILSGGTNCTMRNLHLNGYNSSISSNLLSSNAGTGTGITSCYLDGLNSSINNMNFNSITNAQIANLRLEAPSAIFTGYTFDATFIALTNVHWRPDNTLRYNMIKTGLTNTANNGATGSDIRIGLLPVAKIYPSSAMIEGNGLVGVGALVNVGIETDDTDNIVPVTAITSLPDGTVVQSVVQLTKSVAANRRVVMQVTGANLTAGAVQVTAEFKISNF